jgi:hypothetical protein
MPAMSRSKWTVQEEELPEHVRGKSCTDPGVEGFEQDIGIFREWILSSSVVGLLRHSGELAGELGLKLKKSCVHETVRGAVPGLACEISGELREVVESLGYTSLLSDRGKHYLLFGPLALLQSGQMLGMELGMVQGVIDWSKSYGTRLKTEAGITEGVRLTRLKSHRQPKSEQEPGGVHFNAGDELVVAYTPLMMGEYGAAEDAGKAEMAQEERPSDESRRQRRGKKRGHVATDGEGGDADPRFRRRRTSEAEYRIPRKRDEGKPTSAPEVFPVDDSDVESLGSA